MAVVDSKSSVTSSGSSSAATSAAAAAAEQVPSYEEATSSRPPQPSNVQHNSIAKGARPNVSPANDSQRLYPFPSLGTEREGYGQSPYQSDGTLRIPIGPTTALNAPDPNLPFPGLQSRRGPRAGRRFCVALFWAVILYMCIVSIYVGLDGNQIDHPNHPHPPPKGGPPGWHHHHGDQDEGKKHRHGDKKWFGKRSLAISSWQSR